MANIAFYIKLLPLTLFIVDTGKQVLQQTVKTRMKCYISLGSALFAKIKQSSGTETHNILEVSTCDPLEYKIDNPKLIASIPIRKSFRIVWFDALRLSQQLWSCWGGQFI